MNANYYYSSTLIMTQLIILGVICLILLSATWKLYKKADRPGWASIIPFYNNYVLFDIVYGNGWKFLLMLIPLFNIYVYIKLYIDLAHIYGKSTGFGVGLIFLNPIFLCILGFGSAEYLGASANSKQTEPSWQNVQSSPSWQEIPPRHEISPRQETSLWQEIPSEQGASSRQEMSKQTQVAPTQQGTLANDSIAEIKRYKELLDSGILTEEEFAVKKRELLGL